MFRAMSGFITIVFLTMHGTKKNPAAVQPDP
jgi:hypothetical protein